MIEVGEKNDTQTSSGLKKKILGTKRIAKPKNGSSNKIYNNDN